MNRSRILFASGVIAALIIGIFMGGVLKDGDDKNESGFTKDEVMFAQMMIPHHEQAVVMSDLALKISANPEILALATEIRDGQAPEIEQMKSWLAGADSDSHAGHGMSMDGMLSDAEIEKLSKASGTDFDRLFIEGMIGHHEGALSMLSIIDKSENAEAKALAKNILKSQSAEIITLKNLLVSLK